LTTPIDGTNADVKNIGINDSIARQSI
jgi:hypothetical protein